jgi:hypothetical protein
MRLLVSSGDLERHVGCVGFGDGLDVGVDLAGDDAFEAADRVAFGVSLGDASFEVGDGGCVAAVKADHDDGPERRVGGAVSGAVESSSLRVAARDGDGCGPAQRGEACFGGDAVGVVACGAQQGAGGVVADAVAGEQRCGDRVEDASNTYE